MLWLLANLFAVWETVTEIIGLALLLIVFAFMANALMPARRLLRRSDGEES